MNTYRVFTARMSLALHTSSSLERFERGNAIEIRNGIMFDFYPGLPHIYSELLHEWAWYKYFHKSKASENTAHEKENNNNNNNNNNNYYNNNNNNNNNNKTTQVLLNVYIPLLTNFLVGWHSWFMAALTHCL